MMTESEYIRATNLAKLRAADRILRDILAGKNWGVQEEQKAQIVSLASGLIQQLEKIVKTKGE